MSRMTSHGVETMLRSWADAQAPVASPALASFMGPLVPLPALATSAGQFGAAAAQAGLSTKVIAGIAAVAVTGAAAYGVNHLRNASSEQPRPPQSVAPVVPGAGDHGGPTAPAPAPSPSSASPTESESPEPETAEPTPTRTPSPQATRPAAPQPQTTEAAHDGADHGGEHGDGSDDHTAKPTPTKTDRGGGTKTDTPEASQSAGGGEPTTAAPTTSAPAPTTSAPAPTTSSTGKPKNSPSPSWSRTSKDDDDHHHH
ncbi:MAG: hypothetical protein AB7O74_11405 [Candidatus Nanopelagicales bacterium]